MNIKFDEQHLFNTLMDNIPDAIYFKDTESRFIKINRAQADKFNLNDPAQALGKTDFDFFSEEHARQAYNDEQSIIKTRQNLIDKEEKETWFDGTVTWVLTSKLPIYNQDGQVIGIMGISRDITKRKTLEDELRQSQKMEAVGKLAGGIAHDFNNILTIILGHSELILSTMDKDNPINESIRKIKNAGEKAASFTSQLLVFSKKQQLNLSLINLNVIIGKLEKMLDSLVGTNIEFIINLDNDLWNIKADPVQIEQVLFNLIINAQESITDNGKIILESENVNADEEEIKMHETMKNNDYVMLTVSDNGKGMNKEILSHIFEPFYTTKKNGTGLGLSTVYGIIKQNNGYIYPYSELGKGTVFKVFFPGIKEAPSDVKNEEKDLKGKETILLAEDDVIVRDFIKTILRDHDYTVFEACNGEEALELFKKNKDNINLIITDIVMPKLDGKGLAAKLTEINPEIKVIFISGYTENNDEKAILYKNGNFIQKPFKTEVLLKKIRQIIN
jgi:two-component system, cell cycle sensor histidine kinase and response regulator CckA